MGGMCHIYSLGRLYSASVVWYVGSLLLPIVAAIVGLEGDDL